MYCIVLLQVRTAVVVYWILLLRKTCQLSDSAQRQSPLSNTSPLPQKSAYPHLHTNHINMLRLWWQGREDFLAFGKTFQWRSTRNEEQWNFFLLYGGSALRQRISNEKLLRRTLNLKHPFRSFVPYLLPLRTFLWNDLAPTRTVLRPASLLPNCSFVYHPTDAISNSRMLNSAWARSLNSSLHYIIICYNTTNAPQIPSPEEPCYFMQNWDEL